jgi:error-prone DNA polymerase
MGAWRRPGLIDQFRKRLTSGMLQRGFTPEYAEAVFRQIRGFGDYGFPESHAASFALLVYVSAWLKYYYPAAFAAALLNSQPLGFYAPAQLVRNAREHGVEVLPVDVNRSEWDCTLEKTEGGAAGCPLSVASCQLQRTTDNEPRPLRLGFRLLDGMARADARRIVAARGGGEFRSVEDFARRTGLGRAAILRLAKAGALGSLAGDRRRSIWEALDHDPRALPLLDGRPCTPAIAVALPPMSPTEEVLADYRTAGLSLRGHPLEFLRGELDRLGVVPAAQLSRLRLRRTVGWVEQTGEMVGLRSRPSRASFGHRRGTRLRVALVGNGRRDPPVARDLDPPYPTVRVAGLVLVRQRPATAKGITFVTLEDETGTVNLIVRLGVWKRYRAAALGAVVLLADGRLQQDRGSLHVVATRLEDLSSWLKAMESQSRDFC